jgi:hypothetical protein
MRIIMLAVIMGAGLAALAGGSAQAAEHQHWRHHRHHHHPIFYTPDNYGYDQGSYDPYYSQDYAPYYGPPELSFGLGFGGRGDHHHWHN